MGQGLSVLFWALPSPLCWFSSTWLPCGCKVAGVEGQVTQQCHRGHVGHTEQLGITCKQRRRQGIQSRK